MCYNVAAAMTRDSTVVTHLIQAEARLNHPGSTETSNFALLLLGLAHAASLLAELPDLDYPWPFSGMLGF